jgi:hypothetical protein
MLSTVTAGILTIEVRRNSGSFNTPIFLTLDPVTNTARNFYIAATGLHTFAQGDRISVYYSTEAVFSPISGQISVIVEVTA